MMKISDRALPINHSTLRQLINELDSECDNVKTLISQLQSPHLSPKQQADILAELLAATIHLSVHCGEDFQNLLSQEMEALPDDDID